VQKKQIICVFPKTIVTTRPNFQKNVNFKYYIAEENILISPENKKGGKSGIKN
jgi:hypothetical protein